MALADLFLPVNLAAAVNDAQFENSIQTLPHSSYAWERIYCTYVQAGDVDGAARFIARMEQESRPLQVGNLSPDKLRQAKYLAVSLIAIVTRVAISSGADELSCYQISDRFIQLVDTLHELDQIQRDVFAATHALIQAVHDKQIHSENNGYLMICREYIAKHIGQKITVSELARQCRLTPNYLSHLFKQVTGRSITEYILHQKIQLAKQLLLENERNCSEICNFLNFSTQSYFIARFKREVGQTPQKWKNQHLGDTSNQFYPAW